MTSKGVYLHNRTNATTDTTTNTTTNAPMIRYQ
jgi:hypothetical protein